MISRLLIGPSGVGKSSLGAWLAQRLEQDFADLDQSLRQSYQSDRLASCLQTWGLDDFYRRSLACLEQLDQASRPVLVAVGAGSQLAAQGSLELVRYPSLCLWAEPRLLWMRSREQRGDPRSLEAFEQAEYSLERQALYQAAADRIDLSALSEPESRLRLLQLLS